MWKEVLSVGVGVGQKGPTIESGPVQNALAVSADSGVRSPRAELCRLAHLSVKAQLPAVGPTSESLSCACASLGLVLAGLVVEYSFLSNGLVFSLRGS